MIQLSKVRMKCSFISRYFLPYATCFITRFHSSQRGLQHNDETICADFLAEFVGA